jgi:hypothetical protein
MWRRLQQQYPVDKDFPPRVARLQALQHVLDGSMYEVLKFSFDEEQNGANEYIKLRDRRPCVRYNLCALAVSQAVAMLFSEGHFPEVAHEDADTAETLKSIIGDTCLNLTLVDAACRGSVGSIALWLRVLEGRIYVDVMDTAYLTPAWNPTRPDVLLSVTERFKVKGDALAEMGYTIPDKDLPAMFWWQRVWTDSDEEWYVPQKVVKEKDARAPKPKIDAKRTVSHDMGVVPVVWIKNLPGGNGIDGSPTFNDEAINTQIECEYQLSQGARALRYAGDPLLLIKEPASDNGGKLVRSAANAMIVNKDGDAKLIEIDGAASEAVVNYVKFMRDLALEQLHASRVNPEKLSSAQSGRAMEMLNQPLIWLADKLRITYGGGMLALLQMIANFGATSQLIARDSTAYPTLSPKPVSLKWPPWYAPTFADLSASATTLVAHTDAGHMSQETAVGIVAKQYDIADPAAELVKIKADEARIAAMAPQVKETINA